MSVIFTGVVQGGQMAPEGPHEARRWPENGSLSAQEASTWSEIAPTGFEMAPRRAEDGAPWRKTIKKTMKNASF